MRAISEAPAGVTRFRFSPHPVRLDSEDRERFAGRLRSALRIARGLGSGFGFEWRTGPAGGVVLELADARAAVWTGGVLFGAYSSEQWRRLAAEYRPTPRTIAVGVPAAAPDLPFPGVGASSPWWSEDVLRTLVRVAPGGAVRWDAAPAPVPRRPLSIGPRPVEPPAPSPLQRRAPPSAAERSVREAAEARRLAPAWSVRVRLTADGTNAEDPAWTAAHIVESAAQFDGGNALRFRRAGGRSLARGPPIWLSESETLALWPSPSTETAILADEGSAFRRLSIGRTADGGPAWLAFEAHQGRHVAVLGETGMGKSSCLVRLAWAARALGGVVLLDPLGETARSFLAGLPERERGRVVWIAAHYAPVGINALGPAGADRGVHRASGERAIGELVQALRRVRSARFPDRTFWGPRLEETLGHALALAARVPGGTMEEAYRLLDEARPLEGAEDPELRREMAALGRRLRERPDDAEGARRLLGEIVRSETLRGLLCARNPRLGVSEAIAPGNILIISGDASEVGEPVARYLLAVWLALLWSDLLGRSAPSKTTVLLDECQWYAHEALAEMVRLGRHRNVHALVATQTLGALPDDVRNALLANVADFILFRGSPDEARTFARWADPSLAERMVALPRGHAILFRGKGARVDPIVTRLLARTAVGGARVAEWTRASRERFGLDAAPSFEPEVRAPMPTEPGPDTAGSAEPPVPFEARDAGAPAWEALRACLESVAPADDAGESLHSTGRRRVSLAVLRLRLGDAAGAEAVLRSLGTRLGRAGAIVGRGRDGRGPFWDLDLARLDELPR